METPESTTIELCPDKILDDVGSTFGLGIAGGSAFHFIRGIYSSPAGARLSGGAEYVRMNAPRVGGSFAVWGGLYSSFICAMEYARQKEDSWNTVFAGAATGGLLSLRQGFRVSCNGALNTVVLLVLTERTVAAVYKFANPAQDEDALVDDAASLPPGVHMGQVLGQSVPETSSATEVCSRSWFGGLIGSGKKKETEDKSGSTTQILESFDASHVPIDEFN
ncbi:Mitochondrial import inner membrane translocase subunit TIM17-1 [Raphanus sativus]|uniref:Mitochondrial import inner membrane translocase subunit TIM17-1-like n=1 Tax=Raphanus sativus TaxID=3726 RepID=A0A9W3CCT8_RAPSA|nr:mitochondrial import inner membrane translocase subunit TIM17-1-like [Raphanus sativus]KAJ4879556.1 Mitochondrial import inner membrane translocase subunit TIM17-1 [Raphanus sativus]